MLVSLFVNVLVGESVGLMIHWFVGSFIRSVNVSHVQVCMIVYFDWMVSCFPACLLMCDKNTAMAALAKPMTTPMKTTALTAAVAWN